MGDAIAEFWAWCADRGVVSKRLRIQRDGPRLSLHAGEALSGGAVLITVPYLSALNAQTITGDMRPAAMPSPQALLTFLLRRGRMDVISANSLWLAGSLACYQRCATAIGARALGPMLSPALLPPLPSPFTTSTVFNFPAIATAALPQRNDKMKISKATKPDTAVLDAMSAEAEAQLQRAHAAMQFYQRRCSVQRNLIPTLADLRMAHRTVLQRALLLPLDAIPSAPGDLADLFTSKPDLPTLPTLVPVVDLIRSPMAAGAESDAANCSLHTCTRADFVSPTSRRRVVLDTAPLASACVVVCAARNLKEGDELLMDYD